MLRRVLIVTPHFPPINKPDHQRVRMSLPYFREFGWEPTVLTVAPSFVEGKHDLQLLKTVPPETTVIATKAVPSAYTRRFGLGDLGVRAWPYLGRAGDKVLQEKPFDVIYISTTVFHVMALGPRWLRRWGIPYVLDFQDPWLSDYFDGRHERPPGGHFKYQMSQRLARMLEPYALKSAAHVISVSPAYPETLMNRYHWLGPDHFTVLPFGASQSDFEQLSLLGVTQSCFDKSDGKKHWVYVGRGGSDMALAVSALFEAVARSRSQDPSKWKDVILHFVGTDYAQRQRAVKTIEPIALQCGISDLVRESTERIPYLEGLRCLLDADALIVPGSDDPSYTPSKIYPYILADKPLLAILHEASSAVKVIKQTNAGIVVTFSTHDKATDLSLTIEKSWLRSTEPPSTVTNFEAFDTYSAREITRKHCEIFDRVMSAATLPISRTKPTLR
ncbi:MAG TPA: glycosyltransferase [Pyrinomonadaceae bacterium]|nr:glycosyltransferase [Pyrinomonadaceae bacterium]